MCASSRRLLQKQSSCAERCEKQVGAVSSRGTDFRIIQVTDRTAAATELTNAKRGAANILADADRERVAPQELRRNGEEQLPDAHEKERQAIKAGDAARHVAPVPMVCGVVTEHQRNYAFCSLRNDTAELWASREGQRNIKLNAIAYSMGRQIARGWIARDRVEEFLLKACKANGLFKDDGDAQCRATIASGINAGMKRPYHDIGAA